VFQACTSVGTVVEEAIELRAASGSRMTILNYVPNGGVVGCKGRSFPGTSEPSVEWTDQDAIRVSIAVLDSVTEKHDAIDGLRVKYELGAQLALVCSSSEAKP